MSSFVAVFVLLVVGFLAVKSIDRNAKAKIETIAKDFALDSGSTYEFSFRTSFDSAEVAESFRAAVSSPSIAPIVRISENGLRWVVEGKAETLADFVWYRSVITVWTREMTGRPGASVVVIATASRPGSHAGFLLSTDVANGV